MSGLIEKGWCGCGVHRFRFVGLRVYALNVWNPILVFLVLRVSGSGLLGVQG